MGLNMRYVILVLSLLFLAAPCQAATKAFPGAVGFGAATRGAYAKYEATGLTEDLPVVLKVTNTNDSGAGSFRAAIEDTRPRIIVFQTGGIITIPLDGDHYTATSPYVTIAGQTAPGDGIVIRGGTVRFTGENMTQVIVRGMKVRPTFTKTFGNIHSTGGFKERKAFLFGNEDDCPACTPSSYAIFDHNSTSWSTDVAFSLWNGAENVTVSNNIFAFPSTRDDNAHNYGVANGPGAKNITHYRNIIANSEYRNPLLGGDYNYNTRRASTQIEVINNVVYNGRRWNGLEAFRDPAGSSTPYSGSQAQLLSLIGNYHKAGPNTQVAVDGYNYVWGFPSQSQNSSYMESGSKVFLSGNLTPRRTSHTNKDEWLVCNTTETCSETFRVNARDHVDMFTPSDATATEASVNFSYLLGMDGEIPRVGAYPRDIIDSLAINEIKTGTAFVGTAGSWSIGPTSATLTSDWENNRSLFPSYSAGTSWPDTDNDGMSDTWEVDTFGDLDETPHTEYLTTGYSNIETWINSFFIDDTPPENAPAFPGAKGFGTQTRGAYSGSATPAICKVINTNDSGSGSFRACIEASGPRVILFMTGGVITLASDLRITNPYVTIAGQTAPGDGIVIRGGSVKVFGRFGNTKPHDMIIRGLRVRPTSIGSFGVFPSEERDGIGTGGDRHGLYDYMPERIIIANNSVSWSTDESLALWAGAKDITIQNNLFFEPSTATNHHFGPLIAPGATYVSYHHNIFASGIFRAPLVGGTNESFSLPGATNVEVINNISYNTRRWGALEVARNSAWSTDQPQAVDIIHDYHKRGPSTEDGGTFTFQAQSVSPSTRIYTHGNLHERRPDQTRSELDAWASGSYVPGTVVTTRPSSAFTPSGIPITEASANYAYLTGMDGSIPRAGAYPRDIVDTIMIEEVTSGTAFEGNKGSYTYGPTNASTTSDWRNNRSMYPAYATGTAWADTDNDGMADTWEVATFGDLDETAHDDTNRNGWTNLEDFINSFFLTEAITTNYYTLTISDTSTGTGDGVIISNPTGISCGSGCSASYAEGTSVTLYQTPYEDHSFIEWTGVCAGQPSSSCTITMDGNKTASAVFAGQETTLYTLTITDTTGPGSGTITSSPAGVSCGTDCDHSFAENTEVTLSASADIGSQFSAWSGACAGQTGDCALTMNSVKSASAEFILFSGGGEPGKAPYGTDEDYWIDYDADDNAPYYPED